jgi:hypothetical protein
VRRHESETPVGVRQYFIIFLSTNIILQVQECEEEIALLKSNLEHQDQEHKNQILNLESIWNLRVMSLESEKSEFEIRLTELQLKLNSSNTCDICCERGNISPNGRQTDAEKMWQKSMLGNPTPRTMSQSGLSPFIPHIPLSPRQGGQGPTSLPLELVNNAHREVRRLQELRRYIQEECDQLLLKKDRLKEEVVHQSVNNWHAEQSSRSLDVYFHCGERGDRDIEATHSPSYTIHHQSYKVVDTYYIHIYINNHIY